MEVDADMYPKYLTGEAMSIAESYDAAKIQAMELARLNLAGQLQSEVTALVENSVGNQQMSREEAASITQTIMESKALFSQNLGRVVPVLECYREKDNKNKEVRVVISYNTEMATEMAKRLIRQELEKKGEQLRSKFDRIQKMIYRILSILICGVFSIGCLAQRVKTVGGEYTYVAPKNMSPEEAERVAFERLKTKLIAEEFGTVVSQTNLTKVENQNGQSNIDFSSYGGSEVKGEWIETVKGPHFENGFVDGLVVVKVSAEGKIREIVSSKVEFDFAHPAQRHGRPLRGRPISRGRRSLHLLRCPRGRLCGGLSDRQREHGLLPTALQGAERGQRARGGRQALRLRIGGLRSAGRETDRGRILHDLLAAAGGQPALCDLLTQRLL